MKEVVILVGPPGAGKTHYCHNNLPDHIRVSQDDHGKIGHHELFHRLISDGAPYIVLDRCNFNRKQRAQYVGRARDKGYKIRIVDFISPGAEILCSRILAREGHPNLGSQCDKEKILEVVQFFLGAYQKPEEDEYDELDNITND